MCASLTIRSFPHRSQVIRVNHDGKALNGSAIASARGEVRDLGQWINSLAEDVERGRDALAHEHAVVGQAAQEANVQLPSWKPQV
jgi:hypothetical protein